MCQEDVVFNFFEELIKVILIIELMNIHKSQADIYQLALRDVLMHPHDGIVKRGLGTTHLIKVEMHDAVVLGLDAVSLELLVKNPIDLIDMLFQLFTLFGVVVDELGKDTHKTVDVFRIIDETENLVLKGLGASVR
jgi:hypothetical protein